MHSRGIVHSSLGVPNIGKHVIFFLPAFERSRHSKGAVVGGYVKIASPEFCDASGAGTNLQQGI